jgi:uncharacterized protein YecE (DUF72 family)
VARGHGGLRPRPAARPPRKHASRYSAEALRRWAGNARRWRDRGLDVFVYCDNDAEGHAVRNARTFAELIGE